ncbi:MAG TPA: hypothetical protein VLV78_23765 [Thermoanaerobaculia bacterium]|nr:hypothetical protein [Thermoanaerobaculia bacterium]
MNILRSMNALLRNAEDDTPRASAALLAGAAVCCAIYAAASGFFQGGLAVVFAAVKMPLIIFGSLILCLPSLYIFTAFSGGDVTFGEFTRSVAAFCGVIGLVLLALMPVSWLFAVSSISLAFVVWLHIFVWVTALVFAQRVLFRSAIRARGAVGLWLTLLFLVSLQMTTYLRPVLRRPSDGSVLELEKESFFTHLQQVVDFQPAPPPPILRGIRPPSPAATLAPPPAANASPQSR